MIKPPSNNAPRLTNLVGLSSSIQEEARRADDQAWIDVIHQMDKIYADLVHYQVELEEKNSALEDAQNFIQGVISSMSEILIVCSSDGKIQQVNDALINCLKLNVDNIIDSPVEILFSEKYASKIAKLPIEIRSESIVDFDLDLINSNNEVVPMAINCNALFDKDHQFSGFVITGRPLGELRIAYAALQTAHEKLKATQLHLIQSEKMASLGRLVAGVAHELNNPISFLFANMHALKSYQQKFQTYLNAIHQNISLDAREKLRKELKIDTILSDMSPLVEGSTEGAERVSEIVQNLQKFTTPQQTRPKQFDLVKVVKRAVSWVLQTSDTEIVLSENYPDDFLIKNNEGYVHQIIINLIQNAIDAIENQKTPKLSIQINQNEDQVNVHINDNGDGIEPSDLVKIFDPFFTTKSVGHGTGLGLYISYGLATDQCRGDLKVSNSEMGGAEFILCLPLEVNNENI